MRILIFFILIFAVPISSLATSRLIAQNDPEAITGVQASMGAKDIAEAWFVQETTRYPHYVRGQRFEPSGLRVRLANAKIATLVLDEHFVFEDRTPRLADLDGDGRDEIIVVLTSVKQGSALAAYSIEQDEIELKARTAFIGQSFRWLNPAGIADYDGDGALDVALVQKPHLSKTLEFWTLKSDTFVRLGSIEDVSNHHNGSAMTDLAANIDFDGDGITEIAVLSGDYRTLRILGFSDGRAKEKAVFPLPSPGIGNFVVQGNHLLIRMRNGEHFEFTF